MKEKIKKMTLDEFRVYAHEMHKLRGYKYDEHEYSFHLDMVETNVIRFAHLLPPHIKLVDMQMAATGHDLIEDCGVTYNEILIRTNKVVADLVLAVSDVPAENRMLRFILTAPKILKLIGAIYLKMCDKGANMGHSLRTGSGMYDKYKTEIPFFKYVFFGKTKNIFQPMWDWLEAMVEGVITEEEKKTPEVKVPVDVESCIKILIEDSDEKGLKEWAQESEDNAIFEAHHTMGRLLRNDWGLWGVGEPTEIHKWFNKRGIKHGDDISTIILISLHRHLNGVEMNLEGQLERYWKYWTLEQPAEELIPTNMDGVEDEYLNKYKKFIETVK